MKKFNLTFFTILNIVCGLNSYAQEELNSQLTDYIESLMEDENNKIDFEELEERFLTRPDNKISLNEANADDLAQIPTLTESDIQNILIHRRKYGYFQTLYELKNIPNFTPEKIKQTLPFISIEEKERRMNWSNEINSMKHSIIVQYQQSPHRKKGYEKDSSGIAKYAGHPFRFYAKHQIQTAEKFMAGFLTEKDAGERFWDSHSKRLEHQSLYFQLNNIWKFKNLNLGDFKVSFGQGLVIGTSSILGKSSNAVQTFAQREGIYKYSSTNECNALRGGGATISIKNLNISLFLSHRKKDATMDEDYISSFKTDGLHRTSSEIEKKGIIRESVLGGNITFKKNNLQLGATMLFYKYSDSLLPSFKAYNHYKLKMTDRHFNIGINYKYFFRRINFFGEVAIDANSGLASLNGMGIHPNSKISLLALHRVYQPQYQSNFSYAFGENSKNENEKGFYIGAKLLPIKRITLTLYADIFKFPWLKYNIGTPSQGEEFLCNVLYNTNRIINMQLRYKYKDYIEQAYTKQSLRYMIQFNPNFFKIQTLIEGNKTTNEGKDSFGWVISQDIFHHWEKAKLNINLHYAYFQTDSYNNRLYIYERNILNTFSMPMLYGKGHRISLNLKWNIGKYLQLYANYSTYIYTDGRESCGSSHETIQGNISGIINSLVKITF